MLSVTITGKTSFTGKKKKIKKIILFIYISIELDVEKQRKTKTKNTFPLHQEMEEDGKWGHRSVHNNSAAPELLLPLHYLLLLQSGDIHGPESCRINFLCHGVLHKLQGRLIQHLELLLLTLVSAGLFLTLFFPPHSLLTASALSETCFL